MGESESDGATNLTEEEWGELERLGWSRVGPVQGPEPIPTRTILPASDHDAVEDLLVLLEDVE